MVTVDSHSLCVCISPWVLRSMHATSGWECMCLSWGRAINLHAIGCTQDRMGRNWTGIRLMHPLGNWTYAIFVELIQNRADNAIIGQNWTRIRTMYVIKPVYNWLWTSFGVGVTKAPFVNFSVNKIFDLAEVPLSFFKSHLYLTGATAAELRRRLSNIHVIFKS